MKVETRALEKSLVKTMALFFCPKLAYVWAYERLDDARYIHGERP